MLFTKTKCTGCRKMKYWVKYVNITAPFDNEPLKSTGRMCWRCGWKLKRITKQMKNAK